MKVIKQNGNKGKNQTWTPHSQSRAPSRASPCLSEGLKVGRELDSDCLWTWLSRTWWNERPVRQMLEWFPESTAKHHCTKMLCNVSGPPPLGICRITQGSSCGQMGHMSLLGWSSDLLVWDSLLCSFPVGKTGDVPEGGARVSEDDNLEQSPLKTCNGYEGWKLNLCPAKSLKSWGCVLLQQVLLIFFFPL